MAKYRKKPVIVEAEIYQEGMEDGFDTPHEVPIEIYRNQSIYPMCGAKGNYYGKVYPYINTLEGKHYISKGDYIITGVKGERYPCKPDIFKLTYEAVE
jgi:hypothetical protein